jgi:hypothetical protein
MARESHGSPETFITMNGSQISKHFFSKFSSSLHSGTQVYPVSTWKFTKYSQISNKRAPHTNNEFGLCITHPYVCFTEKSCWSRDNTQNTQTEKMHDTWHFRHPSRIESLFPSSHVSPSVFRILSLQMFSKVKALINISSWMPSAACHLWN